MTGNLQDFSSPHDPPGRASSLGRPNTVSYLTTDQLLYQWSSAGCWSRFTASAHWRPSLVSDKHVPAGRFQSVSLGACTGVVFMQPKLSEWCTLLWCLAAQTQLLPDICQAAG